MGVSLLVRLILLSVSALFVQSSFARDYTRWGLPDGAKARLGKGSTSHIAYSPDGAWLATGGSIGVWLYDAKTGTDIALHAAETGWTTAVAFSPNGHMFANASFSNRSHVDTIQIWETRTGRRLKTITQPGRITSIAFSPDGLTLASGGWNNTVGLWDVRTGENLQTLEGHTESIWSVAFSPKRFVVASGSVDETIRLWNARTGEPMMTLKGHTGGIWSVALSPDGFTLASGSHDNTIRLWDTRTGHHLQTLIKHTARVTSVAFSPGGDMLASGGHDKTIRLWDARTGEALMIFEGHTQEIDSLAFSPDGFTIASGSDDGTVRLWDALTGGHLQTLSGHTDDVTCAVFSPDGSILASGGGNYDRTVRLWEVRTGKHLRSLSGHRWRVKSVAFSPDGNTLASGSWDSTILLWDLRHATTWGDIKQTEAADGTRQLLKRSSSATSLTPTETALLPNYPNPFNPETWIPYQLGEPAKVVLKIYGMTGQVVRTLPMGHQPAGVYQSRERAAYWDGRNQQGESVANGVYFCTLRAGNSSVTRKMLIGK